MCSMSASDAMVERKQSELFSQDSRATWIVSERVRACRSALRTGKSSHAAFSRIHITANLVSDRVLLVGRCFKKAPIRTKKLQSSVDSYAVR